MRSLVLTLALLGLVVGLVPLSTEFIANTFLASDVEYNGIYEPLRGVEMSRAYETALDLSFEVRAGLFLRWWGYWLPLVGAGFGAALGLLLHRLGFRLHRQSGR